MKRVYTSFRLLLAKLRPVAIFRRSGLAIALACALMVFSVAAPAMAFGNSSSSPDKGLEQLDGVQKKSEEAITGEIDHANDGESVTKNSQEGLNGVQGAANKENMKNPANSGGAVAIEENIKEALEDVTP